MVLNSSKKPVKMVKALTLFPSFPRIPDVKTAFDEAYLEAYGIEAGSLSPYTWAAYDAGAMLVDAIKSVAILGDDGTLYIPRTVLTETVRSTTGFQGLTGTMTCDEVGECNASGPDILCHIKRRMGSC